MGDPGHVQLRFAVVPLVEQLVHLLFLCYSMKSLLLLLQFLSGVLDEGWMGDTEYGVLPHVLKELHHTFPGKVSSMEDAGFIEELLLHIEVVAPVPCLQEGGMTIKTGFDEASQCSQYNQEEEDGPANCLDRAKKVSYTKPTKAIHHLVQRL